MSTFNFIIVVVIILVLLYFTGKNFLKNLAKNEDEKLKSFANEYLDDLATKTYIADILAVDDEKITYVLSDKGTKSEKIILWQNIHEVELNDAKNTLTFTTVGEEPFTIDDSVDNWFLLLKNIPRHYIYFDHAYVENLFAQLQPCEVCGFVAVHDNTCQACYEVPWAPSKKYPVKEDYLRATQLDVFASPTPEEEPSFDLIDSRAFERLPNWQPLISKEELREFSREEYS